MTGLAWTSHYVGLPYQDCGRSRAGLDCWGLVRLALEEVFCVRGLPDFAGEYSRSRDRAIPEIFTQELRRWRQVPEPVAGDIVVLRLNGRPWHVGLMVDKCVMLTIDRGTSSCLERLDSPRWKGRLDGFYRYAG
jgi:cell wall-associated NlpC family hydrolase